MNHARPGTTLRLREHLSPGLLRLLDALSELPAQVVSDLGVIVVQNRMAIALLGGQSAYTGPAESAYAIYAGGILVRLYFAARSTSTAV